jgi:hypothetical protein
MTMKVEVLENWEAYEKRIQEFEKMYNDNPITVPHLFRGQANSAWNLETTLERYTSKVFSVEGYNWLLKDIKPYFESYTNQNWKFTDYKEDPSWTINPMMPNAELAVYLRHIGFPSPLLDWSLSPYVAAYFAFNDASENTSKLVSIYTYWESSVGSGIVCKTMPYIFTLTQTVKTHKRHYIQQSRYTFCRVFSEKENRSLYCSHEKALSQAPKLQTVDFEQAQDLLWCYQIPVSEKYKVLKKIDSMNINSYTLFHTKEALASVLARQLIHERTQRERALFHNKS